MKSKIYILIYIVIPILLFGTSLFLGFLGLASWGNDTSEDGLKVVETYKIDNENTKYLLEERTYYKSNNTFEKNSVFYKTLIFENEILKSDIIASDDVLSFNTEGKIEEYINDEKPIKIEEVDDYEISDEGQNYIVRELKCKDIYYYHIFKEEKPRDILSVFSSDFQYEIEKIIVLRDDINTKYCQIDSYFTYVDGDFYGQVYMSPENWYVCNTPEFLNACNWILDNSAYENIYVKGLDSKKWFQLSKEFLDKNITK